MPSDYTGPSPRRREALAKISPYSCAYIPLPEVPMKPFRTKDGTIDDLAIREWVGLCLARRCAVKEQPDAE